MPTQQIETNFIGRQTEIEIFKQWLHSSETARILYFHDALEEKRKKGGAGKTWLLHKSMTIARELEPGITIVLVDFFDVSARDGVTIAERVVTELAQAFPAWSTQNFSSALESYHAATNTESAENVELRSELVKALTTDLTILNKQLATSSKKLLVFFDTYELIEQNPTIAVLSFARMFPDTYQLEHIKFVIASRNKINWEHPNWLGREKEVQVVPIKPFSLEEMVEYLVKESVYDRENYQDRVQDLYKRTEGRPILVGLVADVLNHHVISIEDLIAVKPSSFESYLVTQIQRLEDPLNWVILFMAHVYHRFNATILHWILTESSLREVVQEGEVAHEELIAILPTLSFVRSAGTGDDLVLHDEMRRLVNRYCWEIHDRDREYRKAISRCVIDHYKQELAHASREQERQLYTIEILYHMLFLNVNDGLAYFKENFSWALNLSKQAFCRTLLQETLPFHKEMTPLQHHDLQFSEAQLLRIEENPQAALAHYRQLEEAADSQWLEKHDATILWEQGRCQIMQSNFVEAFASLEHCLELERERGNEAQVGAILNLLGFTYRNQGQFDTAQKYYEEGLALFAKLDKQSEYANMINNLSFIDKQRGKTQLALRHCQIGLRIRRDLFQAGKISEYPIGLSLSTMGQIYLEAGHTIWSNLRFQEAFQIYNRVGRKRELAATYNRFGQLHRAKGEYQEAKYWLDKAQEASVDVNTEAYITCLNEQARLLLEQKQPQEALPILETAIAKAKQVRDEYQQVVNLVDLTKTLHYLNQDEQANIYLQEARTISDKWNYSDLLGQIEEFLGELRYEKQEYKVAFEHYQKYCYYMAIRNEVAYNDALNLVIDRLFDTPKEETASIVNAFVAFWSEHNMDQKFPELANTLEEVRKGKFLEDLPGSSSFSSTP